MNDNYFEFIIALRHAIATVDPKSSYRKWATLNAADHYLTAITKGGCLTYCYLNSSFSAPSVCTIKGAVL